MPMNDAHDSITVLQLSDIHLFESAEQDLLGLNTYQSLETVLEKIQQQHPTPDLFLLTGDLAQDKSLGAYHLLYHKLSPLSSPIYWIPGNHDDPAAMLKVLNQDPFDKSRSFRQGNWQFILLDSSVPNQVPGILSDHELNRLEQELTATAPAPTVVALHHPPHSISSDWLDPLCLQNREDLWAVLDPHPQVKLVLCGHIHQDFCYERQGVQYLSTPSTCVQFTPRSHSFALDERHPGYRVLQLEKSGQFKTWIERVPVKPTMDLAAQGY